MKKIIIAISVFLSLAAFSNVAIAQFSSSSQLISAGISAGMYGRYYQSYSQLDLTKTAIPPISLQYEMGLGDDSGLENFASSITYGVFLGFSNQNFHRTIESVTIPYDVHKNYMYFWGGIVGSFHFVETLNSQLDLSLDSEKIDMYVSIKTGLIYKRYTSNYDSDPTSIEAQNGTIKISIPETLFYLAPVIGVRYYFVDNIAVFCEIGRANLSYMTLGLTMKI